MRTRERKILRDIWSRKARTLLVAISIFIGVFGTVTLFTMGDLLVRQLEEDLDEDALAMIRAYLAVPPGVVPDNDAVLSSLRALPGVTVVEGQAANPVYWKRAGDEDFRTSFVLAYSESYDQLQLEPPRLEEGRFPQSGDGLRELAVEERFAKKYDLSVGDELVIRALGQVDGGADVQEETWTIVGMLFHPYGYQTFTTVLPEDTLFANYDDAQHLAGFVGFSSIYTRYTTYDLADAESKNFDAAIARTRAYIPVFSYKEDPAENGLIGFAETTGNVMSSLALIALTVSGFLVFNVLNAIVTEQRQQIGVMKSLGATRLDNFLVYCGMALVYGVIGVVFGVALGIPGGYVAAQGLAGSASTTIREFGYSERAIVMGVFVGLAVPVLASLLPVFNGTRVTIIQALTDLGIASQYGQGPLARLVKVLPVPITVRQGISNVLRKKSRMLLTVITLTLAAGAFMGIYAVFASVDEVLTGFFNSYDFQFSVQPMDAATLPEVEQVLAENYSDLAAVGPYLSVAIDIDGFDKEFNPGAGPPALFASGYDPASGAFALKFDEGQGLETNPDGVLLARPTADYIDKAVGDVITIRAGGRSGQYPIEGIVTFPYDGVWFDWRTLSVLGGFVDENGDAVPTGVIMRMPGGDPTASEVDDLTEQINEDLLTKGISATYGNIELFKETISNAVATFRMLFNFTALLIALVGAVGLLSTLSMSVYERQKEIGVMRSIGAGSLPIVVQFLTEGIVVGLLAWLLGLPLSLLLNEGLISALSLGDAYKLGYPPEAALLGLVGILLITTVASLWPSLSAARKTVSDILRYQ